MEAEKLSNEQQSDQKPEPVSKGDLAMSGEGRDDRNPNVTIGNEVRAEVVAMSGEERDDRNPGENDEPDDSVIV